MKQVKNTVVSVFALILAFMWLAPLVWLVETAFSKPTFHMVLFPNSRFTFGNLSYMWDVILFARYYLDTLVPVVVTSCIQFVTPTLAAYALAAIDFKGRTLVFAVILIQITIPSGVLIISNFMTLADMGLTDAKAGTMLLFFENALTILLLRQHFKFISRALAEAAGIDGANTWQAIWRVYISCAKPAYIFFAVTSISRRWNNYLWFLTVTNSPSNRTLTVGLAIFAKFKEANMRRANVCAATSIIILPLLIAFFFLRKQFMNNFINAGVKE